MITLHVAFDIDGTLRANREERHRTEVEINPDVYAALVFHAKCKNTELHLWSNRGAEYCLEIRKTMGLEKMVKEKNCHKKLWYKEQIVEARGYGRGDTYKVVRADVFRPDIAYDDQQDFDGAERVIVVREK